jgi:hypothetical protein
MAGAPDSDFEWRVVASPTRTGGGHSKIVVRFDPPSAEMSGPKGLSRYGYSPLFIVVHLIRAILVPSSYSPRPRAVFVFLVNNELDKDMGSNSENDYLLRGRSDEVLEDIVNATVFYEMINVLRSLYVSERSPLQRLQQPRGQNTSSTESDPTVHAF